MAMELAARVTEHDLTTAVEIAAFLEGRKPGDSLSDDFIFGIIPPHWCALSVLAQLMILVPVFIIFWPRW